jgi:nitrous oxide reductase accessory protein NosL
MPKNGLILNHFTIGKGAQGQEFSDDEMNQIKHYSQMLGGRVTVFDEAVKEALNKRHAARDGNAKKMHAVQNGGGDIGQG